MDCPCCRDILLARPALEPVRQRLWDELYAFVERRVESVPAAGQALRLKLARIGRYSQSLLKFGLKDRDKHPAIAQVRCLQADLRGGKVKIITYWLFYFGVFVSLAACATKSLDVATPTLAPTHTLTSTAVPTFTGTSAPSIVTDTPVLHTATDTSVSPTATFTQVPTATDTPVPTPEAVACPRSSLGSTKSMLTFVNKSGFDVFISLENCGDNGALYNLTIPSGTVQNPTNKIFTVNPGIYRRSTSQCNGVVSTGILPVEGNLRLTFSSCQINRPTATAKP